MKVRILILLISASAILESCSAHCQADKWRNKRYVNIHQQLAPIPSSATAIAAR